MTTYRLFPSTNGPSSPVSYGGNFLAGILFKVTAAGLWFNGYYHWVPTGGDTVARKFALWAMTGNGTGTLVTAATVTSGTLTTGQWNFVPLASPVQLAPSTMYNACTGWLAVNGFPDSDTSGAGTGAGDSFGTGGHTAGITQGPLFAYSDNGMSAPPLYGMSQGLFSTTGTDPTVNMPNAGSNSANFWMDVAVSDTSPAGYAGSYRLYPNKSDTNPATAADSSVNYSVATEFHLAQPVTLNKIWYYSPSGTAQLATSCRIWSVSGPNSGTSVVTNTSPSWSGAAASGWVSCSFSGVTLAAGTYKASVYNGAATPDGWGAKDAGTAYWGTGDGAAGFTAGPLFFPGLSTASLAYKYLSGGAGNTPPYTDGSTTEAGQCTFVNGTGDTYPYLYVDALAQNYWIDVEVTPVTAGPPQSPQPGGKAWRRKYRRSQASVIPSASVSPNLTVTAGLATGVGSALDNSNASGFGISFTAGLASGTGTAQSPTVTLVVNAGLATGTGTAQSPAASLTIAAQLATSTGTAQSPVDSLKVNASLATGTGTAQSPAASLTVNAGLATGTGTSQPPTVSSSGTVNAGLATGMGIAQSPTVTLTVNAGLATGTGTAQSPGAGARTAGLATGTGTAQPPKVTLAVNVGLATGAGTAFNITRYTFTRANVDYTGSTLITGNSLGGTVSVFSLGGTASVNVNNQGGAASVNTNNLGGTVTVFTLGGTASVTSDTLTGTLSVVVNTLSGTDVTDKMQEVDIGLNEFNDATVTFQVKNNGSPMDITGMTVNALFKKTKGDLDSAGTTTTYSSAGGSPAITIVTPSTGSCTLAIPHTDVIFPNWTFYRIDVVNSGVSTTAIYGTVTITQL